MSSAGGSPPYGDPALLDAFDQAALLTDAEGRVVHANAAAHRLLGSASERLIGQRVADGLTAPPYRAALDEVMRQALAGRAWTGEIDAVRAEAGTLRARVSAVPLRSGDAVTGAVVVLSASSPGETEGEAGWVAERLTGLAEVAAKLNVADDLETVTDVVVHAAADAVGATVASLSLLEDDDTLVLAGMRGGLAGAASRWTRYPVQAPTPAGDVVRSGQILVLIGAEAIAERYPDLERASEGERSMVALPLRLAGRSIGVATWSFPGRRHIDAKELDFYGVVADTCAQAIERIRAQEASDQQTARLRFLADVSTKLSESLDYQQTLAEVARMAVPTFADWCAIDLVEDDRLHRLAVEHVDPTKVALAVELENRYPTRREDSGGAWGVVSTGRPVLVSDVTDEMVAPTARDEEHLRLLRRLELRSVLLVPLAARGVVLGVMSWVMAESGRRYAPDDLSFAADLGRRAALAIDNSRLHTDTQEAADRLQHAVLPDLSTPPPGWQIGTFYSPAGKTEVGGDFFDAIPIPDGRLAVFVGDVMGRGVRAAAAMAQMRAAIRAYVADDPEPSAVSSRMDHMFELYDIGRLVTMVYVLFDTVRDTAVMVNAGHPPPVLLRADGATEQLPSAEDAPLGVTTGPRHRTDFPFAAGDLLLAFSDGLIERRSEDIDAGQARVLAALPRLAGSDLTRELASLVDAVRDHTRTDDVAALAVRRLGS